MKIGIHRNETRWSELVESVRKDVECASVIMKGKLRILQAGIRAHIVNSADKSG